MNVYIYLARPLLDTQIHGKWVVDKYNCGEYVSTIHGPSMKGMDKEEAMVKADEFSLYMKER